MCIIPAAKTHVVECAIDERPLHCIGSDASGAPRKPSLRRGSSAPIEFLPPDATRKKEVRGGRKEVLPRPPLRRGASAPKERIPPPPLCKGISAPREALFALEDFLLGKKSFEEMVWYETQAFYAIVDALLWPLAMLLFTLLVILSEVYAAMCRRVAFALTGLTTPVDTWRPDSGLYWYDTCNVCQKDGETDHFKPDRPSVIYVHGYQPRTIIRRFRESLNWKSNDDEYGIDVNAADAWISAGWNVGVYYWNQYADEPLIQDAEAKIWTNIGQVGMRFRVLLDGGRVGYGHHPNDQDVPSVGKQLAAVLRARFPAEPSAPYRLVGHSLGCQLVVHATAINARMYNEEQPAFRLPSRIALLDAFWTMAPKSYMNFSTIGSVMASEMRSLALDHHIVLEQYQTSILSHPSRRLRFVTAYLELPLPAIPWYKLRARHVCAPYLYFISISSTQARQRLAPSKAGNEGVEPGLLGMARTPDEHVRSLMAASKWEVAYRQRKSSAHQPPTRLLRY